MALMMTMLAAGAALAQPAPWAVDANLGLAPGQLFSGTLRPSASGAAHRLLSEHVALMGTARADVAAWTVESVSLGTANLDTLYDVSLTAQLGPGLRLARAQEVNSLYLLVGPSWHGYAERVQQPAHDLDATYRGRSLRAEAMVMWVSHRTLDSGRVLVTHFGVPLGDPFFDLLPELHLSMGLSFPAPR